MHDQKPAGEALFNWMQRTAEDGLLDLNEESFDVATDNASHVRAAIKLFLKLRCCNSVRATRKLDDGPWVGFAAMDARHEPESTLLADSGGLYLISGFGHYQK